jgi:hypothetical protein
MCVSFIEWFSPKRRLVWFFLWLCAENVFSTQVELAHGGRGQSYSYDRSSSYSSARRGGVSRRSDYRGWYFCLMSKLLIPPYRDSDGYIFWTMQLWSRVYLHRHRGKIWRYCLCNWLLLVVFAGKNFKLIHFRTTCDAPVMFVSRMYTVRPEVSSLSTPKHISCCFIAAWGRKHDH